MFRRLFVVTCVTELRQVGFSQHAGYIILILFVLIFQLIRQISLDGRRSPLLLIFGYIILITVQQELIAPHILPEIAYLHSPFGRL